MLGRIFGCMVLLAVGSSWINGTWDTLGEAALQGVSSSVELTLALGGMMCFWSGILEVLRRGGILRRLSRLMRPLLRLFFPDVWRRTREAERQGKTPDAGADELCANISANLLGLGNASTPLGLEAMEKMQATNPTPHRATDDMIALAVLNTASLSLVPSTVIALRAHAGSAHPFSIVAAVWICSGLSSLLALILTRLLRSRRAAKERP